MNIYCGVGNLTQEVELFQKDEFCSSSTSIALNSYYKDNMTGEKKSKVTFLEIKAFGKLALNMKKYLKKGSKIGIIGELNSEDWVDKETNKKRTKIVCILDKVDFLDHKKEDNG